MLYLSLRGLTVRLASNIDRVRDRIADERHHPPNHYAPRRRAERAHGGLP